MLCFASRSVIYRPISSRNWSCSFFRATQRVIDGWTRLQSNVWITLLETASLVSRSLICFLLLRSAILLKAAVGAHSMSPSPSDDDRYAPSGHRPTNQNTPSPECRASKMQYESRAVSLFALRSLSRPRYSRLAARISHSISRRSSGRDFRAKERLLAVYRNISQCHYKQSFSGPHTLK